MWTDCAKWRPSAGSVPEMVGKTLTAQRADRAAVVRAALEEAGIDPDGHDELSISGTAGAPPSAA